MKLQTTQKMNYFYYVFHVYKNYVYFKATESNKIDF